MKLRNNLFPLLVVLVLFVVQISTAQKRTAQKHSTNHVNFSTFNHNSDISEGYWFATFENELVCLQLMDSDNRNNPSFSINFCVPKSQFNAAGTTEGFELVRESGTLVFRGGSFGSKEAGDFSFEKNTGFVSFLNKEGVNTEGDDSYYYFKLFLGDVTKDYVLGIKSEGYKPYLKELGKLGIHQVGLDFIRALGSTQYKGLELEMVSKFAIHDVSISYINDLKAAGYGEIDANMVKKYAIHNIGIDYINGLSKLGYSSLNPNMLKKFAVHDISLKYIQSLADAGYGNLEPNMLKNFAVHNISADYIKSLKKTGIADPEASIIKKAKVHNVKARDIERAMANGHDSDNLSDYIRLKIHGK